MHTPDDSEKAKIQRIVEDDVKLWETMSKDQLIDILISNRFDQLEQECAWGNTEYLDELLEEMEG